ncbi:MAG: hypothetical protein WD894_00170 [Pirellulales bacterium]
MTWREELLERLAAAIPCGYERRGPPATEPTCLAAIALSIYGRHEQSLPALQWLASLQNDDGSVGPTPELETPGWPTAWAVLAGGYTSRSRKSDVLGLGDSSDVGGDDARQNQQPFSVERGVQWLLDTKGGTLARQPSMGHDSMLVGWPWVAGTHSWVEPTALAVLALKSVGHGDHPRTREGVSVLHDRLLPDGGCNCGNTIVFGQALLPHIQPTGLALLALYGEKDHDGRIARSLDWLQGAIDGQTAAASLAYATWALARYGRNMPNAESWLAKASERTATMASPYRMALLILAGASLECDDLSSLSFSNALSHLRGPSARGTH